MKNLPKDPALEEHAFDPWEKIPSITLPQLPPGMEDCTITFKECPVGHGTLSATNWVQHPCEKCESDKNKALIRELVEALQYYADLENKTDDLVSVNKKTWAYNIGLVARKSIQKAEAALKDAND